MRRADIALVSVVTDGADYISTLPGQGRGVGVLWRSQFAPRGSVSRHLGPKASVVTVTCGSLYLSLRQKIRLYHLRQPSRSRHRNANPVVGLVPVQRSLDSPPTEKREKSKLAEPIELLCSDTPRFDLHPSSMNHTARARLESSRSSARTSADLRRRRGSTVSAPEGSGSRNDTRRGCRFGSLLGWCSHELGPVDCTSSQRSSAATTND